MARIPIARIKITSNTNKYQLKREVDKVSKKIANIVSKKIQEAFK
ncbi:hypothetical protein OAQ99_04530 [Candidatus Kapabacteria bacterium]|nr:hypothetical protein [Candidatus Kapabacteria bacterium]